MRCPECRKVIEGAPRTCPECGAKLPRPRGRRCPTCGTPVSWRAERCFLCGADLERSGRPAWRWLADLGVVAVAVGIVAAWFLHPWQPQEAPLPTETPTRTPTATWTAIPAPPPTFTPRPTATPTQTPTPRPGVITHTVQSGDTLSFLSELYGVPVAAIQEASNLEKADLLRVGQVVTIPLGVASPSPAVGREPTAEATPRTYVVQPGDNLTSIAIRFGTTVDELMALNGLDSADLLRAGQELTVPEPPSAVGTPTATPTPLPPEATRYVVQPGDTLLSIAADYGASLQVLITVNGIEDPSRLRVGQELIIIPGTPTPEPTATPLPPPTATPGPPFPAPALLWPSDGAVIPADQPILLEWTSVGVLAEDAWYWVQVQPVDPPGAPPVRVRIKETSWHLPPELAPKVGGPPCRYRWEVWVVRTERGTDEGGKEIERVAVYLSAPGPSRVFQWGE